jgi:DNA-binding CsgD family transcriptional regulator
MRPYVHDREGAAERSGPARQQCSGEWRLDRGESLLRLIAGGMRDGDIADALSLSQHTVHRHVSNIHAKLGCSTRAAAVAKASQLGML